MTKPRPDYELVEIDEDHCKAVASNILYMVWRRRTLVAPYRRGITLAAVLATKHPDGVGVFQVVETDAVPPESDTRAAFVDFLHLDGLKHFSVTHEGSGFKAASVRAIVAGVHALARPTCHHAVHSTVVGAAHWHQQMQERIGRRESAAHLERIMQSLRRVHVERYPP